MPVHRKGVYATTSKRGLPLYGRNSQWRLRSDHRTEETKQQRPRSSVLQSLFQFPLDRHEVRKLHLQRQRIFLLKPRSAKPERYRGDQIHHATFASHRSLFDEVRILMVITESLV